MTTGVENVREAATSPSSTGLVQGLGLFDATTIVMGSMIGSAIFIVAAEISREVKSPGMFLVSWILAGAMTVMAALSYGELAAMMPLAGGQYVYLRESLGHLFGFLYGWTLFLVIQTGTIAAVAVAFGKFLGIFFPWVSENNILLNIGGVVLFGHRLAFVFSSEQLIAILTLVGLGALNIFGLRLGAIVQNVFTTLKVGGLFGIVGVGVWWLSTRHASPIASVPQPSFWQGAHWDFSTLTTLFVALVGPLFAADAWNNVTFTGSEVKHPDRNLPLSLLIGTVVVCGLYFFCNLVYIHVLPFAGSPNGLTPIARGVQHVSEDRVATAAMEVAIGPIGSTLMAIAIIISTFGCINGMSLAGARVYYAMAKDGLFFPSVARVHPKYHTPAIALIVQAVWACLLTLSGTYNQLLDYVIFAVLIFYILTILGLFRLRRMRPDAHRPYRVWGYPVVPGLYFILACAADLAILVNKSRESVAGLGLVALGIPVYYLWRRSRGSDQAITLPPAPPAG
jgi:APA family basic amino acid/polyamine antiporter